MELFWHLAVCRQGLCLYWAELAGLELYEWTEGLEIEMFLTIKQFTHAELNFLKIELTICIKMDLALNNLQRLICHKNSTNQPTNQPLNQHTEFLFYCHFQVTCSVETTIISGFKGFFIGFMALRPLLVI